MAKISATGQTDLCNHRAAAKQGFSTELDECSKPASAADFSLRPRQVTWEITQSGRWKGTASHVAIRERKKQELSTAEAFHVVDEVAAMHVPLLAVTGDDPLARGDLLPILQYAARHSVRTSLTLLPTSLLTRDAISDLKDCGLMRAAFWLNGSTAALHDPCAASGVYRHTLQAVGWCHEVELPVQMNTTLTRRNLHDLNSLIELMSRLDAALWNVFFLVPPGMVPTTVVPPGMVPSASDHADELLTAEEHEEVFAKLYAASRRSRLQIKTTEGQHYQRFLLQKRARHSRGRMTEAEALASAARDVNDSKALIFINHAGEVYPSRFLPLSGGNIKTEPLPRIYCDSPLFCSLRDSSRLKGKCGRCPARNVCGGSRSRAYALTGDIFAEDPSCAYQPEVSVA